MPQRKTVTLTDPDRWVEDHGDALFRYAVLRVRRSDTAEELVQETFLAALKSRQQFDGRAAERTWMIAILKRKVVDFLRQRDRERPASSVSGNDPWLDSLFNERDRWRTPPGNWGPEPEANLERGEFWDVFRSCLQKLSARLAGAFQLKVVEEQKTEEVCKVLRISPTNLWVVLHRARLRLWQCLNDNWFEGER